jgi:class 3 adenylate cyclase
VAGGVVAPSGTVTFLFTDVEGSTRLWEEYPSSMEIAVARHDQILRSVVEAHDGYVFTTAGDAFAAAFGRAANAVAAAEAAQRRMLAEPWPDGVELRVRMGLHIGEAQERDGDYFGAAVNWAARIMSAAWRSGAAVVDRC